jgi:hypothetical protein
VRRDIKNALIATLENLCLTHLYMHSVISTFGMDTPRYELVSASQQVVAGMNYKLVANVHVDEQCEVCACCVTLRAVLMFPCAQQHTFVVYDHFGDRSISQHRVTPSCH